MSDQNPVIKGLAHILADTYMLYLKTQNFHWNVTGSHFYAWHKMFEEQYTALAEAIDTLAERIRALNAPAPASFSEFLKLTNLNEAKSGTSGEQMVHELLKDHETVSKCINDLFSVMDEAGDEVTLDILIQRKTEHDEIAWMLRSILTK